MQASHPGSVLEAISFPCKSSRPCKRHTDLAWLLHDLTDYILCMRRRIIVFTLLALADGANVTEFIYSDNRCTSLSSKLTTENGACVEVPSAQMNFFFTDAIIREHRLKSQGFSLLHWTRRNSGSHSAVVYCFSSSNAACGQMLKDASGFFSDGIHDPKKTMEELLRTNLGPPSKWPSSLENGFCGLYGLVRGENEDLTGCNPAKESMKPHSCLLDNCHVTVTTDFAPPTYETQWWEYILIVVFSMLGGILVFPPLVVALGMMMCPEKTRTPRRELTARMRQLTARMRHRPAHGTSSAPASRLPKPAAPAPAPAAAPAVAAEAIVLNAVVVSSNPSDTEVGLAPGGKLPLADLVRILCRELDLKPGQPYVQTIEEACVHLGISDGVTLADRAERCWQSLGSPPLR